MERVGQASWALDQPRSQEWTGPVCSEEALPFMRLGHTGRVQLVSLGTLRPMPGTGGQGAWERTDKISVESSRNGKLPWGQLGQLCVEGLMIMAAVRA